MILGYAPWSVSRIPHYWEEVPHAAHLKTLCNEPTGCLPRQLVTDETLFKRTCLNCARLQQSEGREKP